jgi:hypothetical protein
MRFSLLTILLAVVLCSSGWADDRAGPEVVQQPKVAERTATESTPDRQPDDLSWWTVDGGGGESSGGSYTLTATAGQPDAGTLYGCWKVLDGGLWSGSMDLQPVFCDSFESSDTSMWDNTVGGVVKRVQPSAAGGE